MPESRLVIRLTTKTDHPPLDSFLEAVQNSHAILRDIDFAISAKPGGSLRWRIADVQLGSAAITLTPESVVEDLDVSQQVLRAYAEGLATIERVPEIPPFFSEQTLERAKSLVGLLGEEVTRITIRTPGIEPVTITQRVAANVDELIGPRFEAIGTIEGTLETLSVHGRPYFNIYEVLSRRRVACYFPIRMVDAAHSAFRSRVAVTGKVTYTGRGQPVSISVRELRVLRPREELPQAKDIEGTDLTGGEDAADYVRRLRDAE